MAKKLILVFGILGVLAFFIPSHGQMFIKGISGPEKGQVILLLLCFLVPTVLAGMAMSKPPFQKWQAAVSLAAFGLVVVKLRLWELLPHIGMVISLLGIPFLLFIIGAVGGVIASILGLVKGEETA